MNYNDDVLLDHALTMRRLGMDAEEEEDLPLAARLYKQAIEILQEASNAEEQRQWESAEACYQ